MSRIHPSILQFQRRQSNVKNHHQLLALEHDLRSFLESNAYESLSEDEKDMLDEIVVEVLNKKNYFMTCSGC